jgi:hypothetical protein
MNKKYYFISYRICLGRQTPLYGQELTDKTPLEYVIYWKNLGGTYGDRIILFSQEITEDEYNKYWDQIDEE